jgi:hypothetical protein
MFKLLYLLAMLAGVVSCATHAYDCRTPLRAINVPVATEVK